MICSGTTAKADTSRWTQWMPAPYVVSNWSLWETLGTNAGIDAEIVAWTLARPCAGKGVQHEATSMEEG